MFALISRKFSSQYSIRILDDVKKHKVLMYSKTYCPYCKNAKKLFEHMQITPQYFELDIEKDGKELSDALEVITRQNTVPNIFISGSHIGGYSDLVNGISTKDVQKLLVEANVSFKELE